MIVFAMHITVILFVALGSLVSVDEAVAQSPEPLCVLDETMVPEVPEGGDLLTGRLGGTRDAFEARFGPPADESSLFITWRFAGCDDVFVSFEEGFVTDVSVFSEDFESDSEGQWSLEDARRIAERVLPLDVQMSPPYRNISTVEHHECFSDALSVNVPATVYAYVDNNPTQGQCSVVYSLDDSERVTNFTVQLQIEDPN